jgi:hypothetical protein
MKRNIPSSILLLAAIILNRVIISSRQISPAESIRPFLIILLVVSVVFISIQFFVKDWHRTNFLVAMIPLSILVYEAIYRLIKSEYVENSNALGLLLIPGIVFLYAMAASPAWWKMVRNPAQITRYFNLVFVILLGMQVAQLGIEINKILSPDTRSHISAISPLTEQIDLSAEIRPDIYVIILDGYGRQDVLKEIYQYDNSEFIAQLEKRGFYVASQSHSNYTQTAYSIASLMNFDYVQPWNESTDYSEYLLDPIKNNRVFQMLSKVGYTTVSFEGGTSYSQIQNSDILDSGFLPLNKFETLLLTDTPFEPLTNVFNLGIPIPDYQTHRRRIRNHLNMIQSIPDSIPGPKITYFHILVPHPPFVFDQKGNSIEPNRSFSILDGDEYPGSLGEYWSGYREQVIFVNGKILEAIDAILARSARPPIILLMSDHGPGSMFKWDPKAPGCLWERTHNFYAVRLPNPPEDVTLYPGMTPVNTFRVVFNAYFGTHLPLLPDRTYLVSWQHPESIVDTTSSRDSTASCTLQDN